MKEGGDKPERTDISAQGSELKSNWAQWESMIVNQEGLLCRKLMCPGSSGRMQVVIPLSLVEVILEMLHDSITVGYMGV